MNVKNRLLMTLLSSVVLIIALQSVAVAGSNVHVGYLSDVMCGVKGTSGGGFNLITNPEKHTVMCMKMPPCEASGYGLFVKNQKTGKYEFHKFDANGTKLAKNLLKNTKKADHVVIKVTGTLADGVVKVSSILEV